MLNHAAQISCGGGLALSRHRVDAARAVVRLLGGLIVSVTLLLTGGCQAPAVPIGPTETVLRIPDRDAFIDASLSMLRRYDLPPERVDRTRGLIVSQRTTRGQWFEFWRNDSRGLYQLLESSLHTIGGTVTITVEPAQPAESQAATPSSAEASASGTHPDGTDEGGEPLTTAPDQLYRVSVQVDKARFTTPERQITTASGALAIYSERTPPMEGLRGRAAGQARWVPLGRDSALEAFLLGELTAVLPGIEVP